MLIDINSVKMDLHGAAKGDPAVAQANQLANIIELISKHQNLFPNDVQIQVNGFVRAYGAAQKGDNIYSQAIFKLIAPTKESIMNFLSNRLKELSR